MKPPFCVIRGVARDIESNADTWQDDCFFLISAQVSSQPPDQNDVLEMLRNSQEYLDEEKEERSL